MLALLVSAIHLLSTDHRPTTDRPTIYRYERDADGTFHETVVSA